MIKQFKDALKTLNQMYDMEIELLIFDEWHAAGSYKENTICLRKDVVEQEDLWVFCHEFIHALQDKYNWDYYLVYKYDDYSRKVCEADADVKGSILEGLFIGPGTTSQEMLDRIILDYIKEK